MEYQRSQNHCKVEDSIESYHITPMNDQRPSRCIFYIDDSEIDRWLAKHVLETSGLCNQIVIASNGEEGIKAIAEYYIKTNKLPEVIIVDLQMPRIDGFKLISAIDNLPYFSEQNCKVILTTAGLDDEDWEKINELQIKNILLKPLDQSELIKFL